MGIPWTKYQIRTVYAVVKTPPIITTTQNDVFLYNSSFLGWYGCSLKTLLFSKALTDALGHDLILNQYLMTHFCAETTFPISVNWKFCYCASYICVNLLNKSLYFWTSRGQAKTEWRHRHFIDGLLYTIVNFRWNKVMKIPACVWLREETFICYFCKCKKYFCKVGGIFLISNKTAFKWPKTTSETTSFCYETTFLIKTTHSEWFWKMDIL